MSWLQIIKLILNLLVGFACGEIAAAMVRLCIHWFLHKSMSQPSSGLPAEEGCLGIVCITNMLWP